MAELQFLNLPAIDAQIAQRKQAEMQNAMAPFLMQKAQMDAEKGGLEMQMLRDKTARDSRIRNAIADLTMGKSQQSAQAGEATALPVASGSSPAAPSQAASTTPRQQGSTKQTLMDNFIKQAEIYAGNGDPETANKLYEHAAKFMPEVHKIEVGMDNGKPVNVITYKDGAQQISGFGATPKAHYMDTGGGIQAIDEYTQQPLAPMVKKTQSPDSAASTASAAASRAQAERHFQSNFNAPQYMETSQGLVALPKKLPVGQTPVGLPVMGADGQPLGPKLKDIPANANTSITTNLQNLNRAQTALSLLTGKDVGSAKADPNATGWKGYAPNAILNRVDPQGVDARAAIADLGSLVIHDRSGAAVTASEFPRLAPFIPTPTDDAATVQKKLNRFIDVYQQETNALSETYSKEQGYRPNPNLEKAKSSQNAPLAMPTKREALVTGKAYQTPRGVARWDGSQFVAE